MSERLTVPQYFLHRVKDRPEDPAIGWIEKGEVKRWNYREYRKAVESISLALRYHGMAQGEKAAVISNTRKEWNVFDLAVQCAWGTVVPVYPSYLPEEMAYIIQHSDSTVLAFEDVSQLDKIILKLREMPTVRLLVAFTPVPDEARSRLTALHGPPVFTFDDLYKQGEQLIKENPDAFEQGIRDQLPEDLASIVYTSGTTGMPKGAMLTQKSIAASMRNVETSAGGVFERTDTILTFLPLSHIFGRQDSYMVLIYGCQMVFAESIEKIVDNIGLVRPTIMAAVPRIFEKIYARILQQVDEGSKIKKSIFNWALYASNAYNDKIAAGEKPGKFDDSMHKLAWKLVFSKIYERFGGRMRYLISGGASLAPEIMLFLRNAKLVILEGYGLTESNSGICLNPKEHIMPGSVGKPVGDVEIKLAEDGEILIRSQCLFSGYYKNPDETASTLINGWLHTGDIGAWSPEGYLLITDRKKDLIKTSGGKYIVPQKIEGLLKMTRYISQAVIVGEGRNYATALIGIEKDRFKSILPILGLKENAGVAEIAEAAKTKYFIESDIENTNRGLAKFETIKKFYIIPEEFTVDSGLVTASLKVKKKLLFERYRAEIDAMYS